MIEVSAYRYEYKEDPPIKISFHTWNFRPNILLKLKWKSFTGLGEAAPLMQITGDDQTQILDFLKAFRGIDINPEKTTPAEFHRHLDDIGIQYNTLRCALDFAFYDIKGKIDGAPVWKFFSRSINRVPNSVTVYLKDTHKETAIEAVRLVNKFPHMRVMKLKLSGYDDIERCMAVKNAIWNRKTAFCLDANQGYDDPEEAVKSLNRIVEILGDVLLIEEPCPKGELDKLRYVSDNIRGTLIFADETAVDINDVHKIIKAKAAHGVNIKLQKAGGIFKGREIAELAVRNGLSLMNGAMIEGPVGMSAGVHFSNNIPNLILKDLDTDLDMEEHIKGKIKFEDGYRLPDPEQSGLGIDIDYERIERLQKEGKLTFEALQKIIELVRHVRNLLIVSYFNELTVMNLAF